MTSKFNIKTTQKKVLHITEETVVQLSNLDLGNILREKFDLHDAEVLWDKQGGFPVCKLRSVKKIEEQQGVLQGVLRDVLQDVPSAQVDVDPDNPSTWKVGDMWVCTNSGYGGIHPYGFKTSITKITEDYVYSTDTLGDSSTEFDEFKRTHKFLCRPKK